MRRSCDSLLTARRLHAEAETLDVLLRLGHPEVRHDLLETVVAAAVKKLVAFRVGRVSRLARHVRPVADEKAAAVQVREGHDPVGRRERGVVGVLLVRQRLVSEGRDRVGKEDASSSGRGAGSGLPGAAGGGEKKCNDQDGENDRAKSGRPLDHEIPLSRRATYVKVAPDWHHPPSWGECRVSTFPGERLVGPSRARLSRCSRSSLP